MIESRDGVKWISYPIPGTSWFPDGIELGGKALPGIKVTRPINMINSKLC